MGGLNLNLESVEGAMLRLLRMVLLATTVEIVEAAVLELEEDKCCGDSVVHSSVEVDTQLPTELREGL